MPSHDAFGEFPYDAINADTGRTVTIESEEHIWEIVSGWADHHYEYAVLLCSPLRLLDVEAQAWIQRYTYCQSFTTPAFSGSYDEQPAIWLDIVSLIQSEIAAATAYQKKRQ